MKRINDAMQMVEIPPQRQESDPFLTAVAQLSAVGMSAPEVMNWIHEYWDDFEAAVTIGLDWHAHGFKERAARDWLDVGGWTPQEAKHWRDRGYEAHEADFVSAVLRREGVGRSDPNFANQAERGWLRSGLTPQWVAICVAAGVESPEEAEQLQADREQDPAVRGTLLLQGAIRHGADAQNFRFL